MKIRNIYVKNFRNLKTQTVKIDDGLSCFLGKNAQGKTNLLESVYLCCLGKSPRTDKNKEMISKGKDYATVSVDFVSRYGDADIKIALFAGKKKSIAINSVPVLKTGEMIGYLNAVYFSPDEMKLVKSSPENRRKFLDVDLSQTDKNYFYSLVNYNKILAQRNSLLKSAKDVDSLNDMLFVWDTQLSEDCARIVAKREAFCNKLAPKAQEIHYRLTDGKENLQLFYCTAIKGDTVAQKKQCAFELLQKNVRRDFELRFTTTGCQRDDVKFVVNGEDVREYGSQGQQRTTVLSLKLAELSVFKQMTGDYPVLLLDDVLSELDLSRQKQLLSFDSELQIILTATHLEEELCADLSFNKYVVEKGSVTKINDPK